MKTLILMALAVSLTYSQETVKPSTTKSVITDKDRADYLLAQRTWLQIQQQYENAFNKEPSVAAFNSASNKMQELCKVGGEQFNPQTVQCEPTPKPTPAQTAPATKPEPKK